MVDKKAYVCGMVDKKAYVCGMFGIKKTCMWYVRYKNLGRG